MKVLGITGGVGCGKSEVLHYLQKVFHAYVCQMDEVAKHEQKSGTSCFKKILECFGKDLIKADGEIDREKLGRIVFADREKLDELNRIVHPEVMRRVREEIARKKEEGTELFVVESALLPDIGYELCDELWYIYTDESVRRERLKKSRGYTDEKITDMMLSQADESGFRKACTVIIDNSGTFENTKRQIGEKLKL